MDSEAAAAAARSPLVFQCRGCRSILGDSTAWVAAEEAIQAIALKVAPGVKVLSEFDTARSGADAGSSFMPLACNFCDVRVGRVYQTTPQTLDHLRQQFTLHTDKITSYELGTGLEDVAMPAEMAERAVDPAPMREIVQIKEVILVLSEKLEELQGRFDELSSTGGNKRAR